MIDILLEASLRSFIVGVVAWALLCGLRVRSGAMRHAAHTALLLAMLASPVMVVWRPALPVTLPNVALPASTFSVPASQSIVESLAATAADQRAAASSGALVAARETSRLPAASAGPASMSRSLSWKSVASIVWVTGVLVGLLHLAMGGRRLRRFASTCVPVESPRVSRLTTATVVESPVAVAPVVFGIRRPRIVLPPSWRTWHDEDLHATVVHEAEHIRRRDTLVSLVARVNRTVFWFHPLAWWLERALASSAEQACDDAVVRERGDERAYADLIVRLAASVSAARGRVAWQAIGIGGGEKLEARIDRLLSGAAREPRSRTRSALLAIGCAAAITAGMACQQQPAALQPDPEREAAWQIREERTREWQAAVAMTPEEVEAMEARASADPIDLDAAVALLTFYQQRGQTQFGWNAMIERRRPHLLRLIEHHPGADAAGRRMIPSHDPEGYAQARALWMSHVSTPDASTAVLANAASFFSVSEKPLAEELLLRAQAIDADGPRPRLQNGVYYRSWPERLGELYALALVGSNDALEYNVVRGVDPDEAGGPFATHARAALDATDNPAVLVAAGRLLALNAERVESLLDFDVAALGRTYLERALALDPDLEAPRMLLMNEDSRRRHQRVSEFLRNAGADPEAAIAALPELEQLEMFADVTNYSYIGAGSVFWSREDDEVGRQRARRLAAAALQVAARHPTHPADGSVTHNANIVLGTFAIREGDRRTALEHLRAAAASAGSEDLTWMPTIAHLSLVHALLDAGEYEAVAAYYDRLADLNRVGATRWRDEARAIREGRMPESYQRAKRSAPGGISVRLSNTTDGPR